MSGPSLDEQFLRRALDLARQSVGLASPNPHVGAVIVDSKGNLLGEAFHTYSGVKHAEILALEQAGERARNGTLYINLEPHCYQSRTAPCTDALIAAGIKRVVASMPDPNPSVSGRGFEQLRAAGISVEVGGLQTEARRLNEAFAHYIRRRTPFLTLKCAMSLDGKIGVRRQSKESRTSGIPAGGWITGEAARAHVQQQRHESDAILTGVGTILADDPLLTDRTGLPRRRPLLRVILDSHLRLPLDSRIVKDAVSTRRDDILVFYSSAVESKKRDLQSRGVRVVHLPADSHGHSEIHAVLKRLGELDIASLLIEGGSRVNALALASAVVDKVFFYYAPVMLGSDSVPFARDARGLPVGVTNIQVHRFGGDMAIEGYLRDPYES